MKRELLMLLCMAAFIMGMNSCGVKGNEAAVEEQQEQEEVFYKGADISWITEMESKGEKLYNAAGEEREGTALMKELGMNAVRLRVWVDPSKHGNWCNKEDLLVKCKRAAALDMEIMIDFHYSDYWADPNHQNIPEAWKNHSYEEMKQDVTAHTKDVLTLLKNNQINPKWVQVGNETSDGFLWPVGKASENPEQYAGLFKAGYDAAKEVFPETIVIVHLDNGFDQEMYDWNLDILKNNGAKWDMIGLSVYPYWAMQNKQVNANETIARSLANIQHLYEKYGSESIIVETGTEVTDPEKGRREMSRIVQRAMNQSKGHCKGVFYWEPECRPTHYKLGAFDEEGKPTAIMEAFTPKLYTKRVAQFAILCWDINKTTENWAKFLGVETPKIVTTDSWEATHAYYRGKPCHAQIYQSFFNFENIQFELISPMDDTPSVWLEYLKKNGEGLHHIAFTCKDMKQTLKNLAEDGMPVVAGGDYTNGRYSYIDSEGKLTMMLELLEND
jgi:arabinogalactan endo-1,4-beta-galactosidase